MGTSALLGHFARTPHGRLHGFADMSHPFLLEDIPVANGFGVFL
jgi:hypothetical protein